MRRLGRFAVLLAVAPLVLAMLAWAGVSYAFAPSHVSRMLETGRVGGLLFAILVMCGFSALIGAGALALGWRRSPGLGLGVSCAVTAPMVLGLIRVTNQLASV